MARLSFALGVLSSIAVVISFLALTDISHGDGGPPEWRALQLSFVLFVAFHLSALATLWRIIGPQNSGNSSDMAGLARDTTHAPH